MKIKIAPNRTELINMGFYDGRYRTRANKDKKKEQSKKLARKKVTNY